MDNEEQIRKKYDTPAEAAPQTVPPPPKSRKPFILGGIILLLLVVSGAYYLGARNNGKQLSTHYLVSSPTQSISITPTLPLSPTSHEIELSTYTNEQYKFLIRFPKYSWGFNQCAPDERTQEKAFVDEDTNTIYISAVTVGVTKFTLQPDGTYAPDLKSCKTVTNNLDLIKNGYDNGRPYKDEYESNISKPGSFLIRYSRIENETQQLNALVHSIYGPDCFVHEKKKDNAPTGIFRLTIAGKDGNTGPDGGCMPNFIYHFLYSPEHKTAILSEGYQDGPFYAPGLSYSPEIKFIN